MLSFTQDRKKRYPVKVHSKISVELSETLNALSDRTNRPVSEIIRDAIQASLEPSGPDSEASIHADIRTGLELLQTMRMELVSLAACTMDNIKQVSAEAEQVAGVELAAFEKRAAERKDLMKSLGRIA